MEKNNTNNSAQLNEVQINNQTVQRDKMGEKTMGQNKYPSFDMNGNNFSENPPIRPTDTTSVQPASPPSAVSGTVVSTASGIGVSDFSYANWSKRSWAVFIDGLIVGLITFPFSLPSILTQLKSTLETSGINTSIEQIPPLASNSLYSLLSFLGSAVGIFYSVYFIGKKGQTPGKKLMKIKVIDKETKEAPGIFKAFLREIIGKFVSSLFLFLGYFWVIWDRDKQAWHDKIAGTVVVNDRR